MFEYLVEVYAPRAEVSTLIPRHEELSEVAEDLTRAGRQVRLVRSIFVPDDETCFFLFEGQSGDVVREAATRSGLQVERVVEAVSASEVVK